MPKIKSFLLIICSLAAVGLFSAPAMAVVCTDNNACGNTGSSSTTTTTTPSTTTPGSYDPCHPEKSGGTALTKDQLQNCQDCQTAGNNDCLQKNPIVRDLNLIVNLLTGSVSLVVIGVIIVGGIQYALGGGNPNALQAAKKRITNAIIALFMFFLIWAFLQWLIPGGV